MLFPMEFWRNEDGVEGLSTEEWELKNEEQCRRR